MNPKVRGASRFALLVYLGLSFLTLHVAALDLSVPAVGGDISRTLLGDGTGVIVGIIDSGVDETHPVFGVDSLGQPRMVAEGNFVPSEPGNTGDDVHGHGTAVASVVLGRDDMGNLYNGVAPDARFVNARVIDSNNSFTSGNDVADGVGFALEQGADILNLSLNYFSTLSSGNTTLDRMLDWAAQELGVSNSICVGNINESGPTVRGPGGTYNGVTVGRTDSNFDQVHSNSANAFTQNGRMKPDLVAPGTSIRVADNDWERRRDPFTSFSGCSFATPHVAGFMAQQIEAGRDQGHSTSPLVIKATMMNSADKSVKDKSGGNWTPASGVSASVTQPLDTDLGAGQIDGVRLAEQYLAGEQEPGLVDAIGWDLATISADQQLDYEFTTALVPGTELTATLNWFRNLNRSDRGNSGIDSSDIFRSEPLDDLNLQILGDGELIAESASTLDNVEHLRITTLANVDYSIRVVGANVVVDPTELFGLAWSAVAVPEPGSHFLFVATILGLISRRSRL